MIKGTFLRRFNNLKCVIDNRASTYLGQNLTELVQKQKISIIIGDFNIPLIVIEQIIGQKSSKDRFEQPCQQFNLIGILDSSTQTLQYIGSFDQSR